MRKLNDELYILERRIYNNVGADPCDYVNFRALAKLNTKVGNLARRFLALRKEAGIPIF